MDDGRGFCVREKPEGAGVGYKGYERSEMVRHNERDSHYCIVSSMQFQSTVY